MWYVYTTNEGKRVVYWGVGLYGAQHLPSQLSAEWKNSDGSYFFD